MVTSRASGEAETGVEVALVVSPRAAALDDVRSPRLLLQQVGLHVAEQVGVAELAADKQVNKRWYQHRYHAIIAAGGDGTIGTTASQLAGTGIPLGILPMGTSNDVARALGIPLDGAAAASVIASGTPTEVDSGLLLEVQGDSRLDRVRAMRRQLRQWLPRWVPDKWGTDGASPLYFLHAATLGLNVEFARLATDASRRAALGSLTYPASSLEVLTHMRSIPIRVTLSGVRLRDSDPGRRHEGMTTSSQVSLTTEVLELAVVNTPLFGGTLNLSLPGVDVHDHLLDVFLFESPRLDKSLDSARSVIQRLRSLLNRQTGQGPIPLLEQEGEGHSLADLAADTLFPGIRRYQAQAISIETAAPVQLTLDGEVCAKTPVQIQVEPAALTVLLPRAVTDVVAGTSTGASAHSS
jgi:diacylglycerol kinase family enzyme